MTKPKGFVCFRVSDEDREKIDRLRQQSGLSQSMLFRKLLHGAEIRERKSQDVGKLYGEINHIGNNINQITRSVNSGLATPEDVSRALFLLNKVYELMERAVNN